MNGDLHLSGTLYAETNVLVGSGEVQASRITTGTYVGDGTTSKSITGLGFQPKFVQIWGDFNADASGKEIQMKMTEMDTQFSWHLHQDVIGVRDNRVISLDADGFTVDDDGADAEPNKNGMTFLYLAIG